MSKPNRQTALSFIHRASRQSTLVGRRGDWVFVATVIAGYISMFSASVAEFTRLEMAVMSALGVIYAIIGTYGAALCDRTGTPRARALYFGVQIALAVTIMYLSAGAGFGPIILLPLAGQSIIFLLPRHWVLLICLFVLLSLAVPAAFLDGWAVATRATITFLPGIVFTVVFTQLMVHALKARIDVERLAVELSEANRKLGEYAVQAEELATAKERNRLAREIHDTLGHYLTVINVQLEAARAVMEHDHARARSAVDKAQLLTKEGLAEVRRSVAALRAPTTGNRPLPEAIAVLVNDSRATGIITEFVVLGTPRLLPPQAELTLYRAAQEGLTNVCKYAHASRADLKLDYRDDMAVRLVVHDNGVGASKATGGFGLLGVRERVQLLGGKVCIRTAPGHGFMLDVEVPA